MEPISRLLSTRHWAFTIASTLRLTDAQWELIQEHFLEEDLPEGRPGRPPVPTRAVLDAVLWILNTGAQWHMLPQSYPNNKTSRRMRTICSSEYFDLFT